MLLLAAAGGCGGRGKSGGEALARLTPLDEALRPDVFGRAIRRLGGAHFHGTARFAVGAAVTTTTDVWMDRSGNYRLRELNDQDGGRDVVVSGRELGVALRYGKMIRRVAEEPEPTRLLEEALGAPWAAFELSASAARVTKKAGELVAGAKATVYELGLDKAGEPVVLTPSRDGHGARPALGLRGWRKDAAIQSLTGRVVVDDVTGAVVRSDFSFAFAAKAEGGPVAGNVDVHSELSDVAAVAPIPRPEGPGVEELAMRQRLVPEQRGLLRGLPQAPAPPPPKRPPKTLPPGSNPAIVARPGQAP